VSLFAASLFDEVLSVLAVSVLAVSVFPDAPDAVSDLPFCE